MFETMKALVVKKNFENHYQRGESVSVAIVLVVFVGVNHIDNCRDQPKEKGNKQHRCVN